MRLGDLSVRHRTELCNEGGAVIAAYELHLGTELLLALGELAMESIEGWIDEIRRRAAAPTPTPVPTQPPADAADVRDFAIGAAVRLSDDAPLVMRTFFAGSPGKILERCDAEGRCYRVTWPILERGVGVSGGAHVPARLLVLADPPDECVS